MHRLHVMKFTRRGKYIALLLLSKMKFIRVQNPENAMLNFEIEITGVLVWCVYTVRLDETHSTTFQATHPKNKQGKI